MFLCRCDNNSTSTQLILELLAVLVVTLAELAVVVAVAHAPATHTLPSTLALQAVLPLAGGP